MGNKQVKIGGFTIVELLTVMAVIAILIGLLIPALTLVRDNAKKLQQKAQFHSIDVGLELFKSEFGAYPESKDNSVAPVNTIDATPYCGANKLAEAMVGWDFLGFHPKSGFTADGFNDLDGDGTPHLIYDPLNGIQGEGVYNEASGDVNLENRKKFINLENANGFQMQDVYGAGNVGAFLNTSVVLCDVYAKKRISAKKAGMPILYYRARQGFKFQDSTNANTIYDDVYNYEDNLSLLDLNSADDNTVLHPLDDGVNDYLDFEDIIVNQQVFDATDDGTGTTGIKKPYRDDSYFLLSAGKDGLYGTADDILNFDKETTE